MDRTPKRKRRGFTLLELLIAAGLSVGMVLITAQFWRYYSRQLEDLKARAHVAQELRIALGAIRRDMGPAVGATPVGADQVLLCIDGGPDPDGTAEWGAPDTLVTYSLVNGKLVRTDQASGVEIVLVDHVSGFTVEDITASLLQMTVAIEKGGISRQMVLRWSRP